MPMEKIFRVNFLSKLATTKMRGYNRTVKQMTLSDPNIEADESYNIEVAPDLSWISLVLRYMQEDELLQDEKEAKKFKSRTPSTLFWRDKSLSYGNFSQCYGV